VNGTNVELLDYYPFGAQRISSGSFTNQRQYIGQEYDEETNLNYLNARYYNEGIGRFISEDPVFWEIGSTKDGKDVLVNPQAQNSYSYAGNNPINKSDPTGRIFGVDDATVAVIVGTYAMYAPQINSLVQSLSTPLGQFGLSQAMQDAQKGNYKMALLGALTAPEFPSGNVAKGLSIGDKFGKLGTVVENIGGKINSFDPHALMRMSQRGVDVGLMEKVVSNPLVTLSQVGDRTLYLTREAAVVLDNTGRVITTYTKNEFKPHVLNVLKSIKSK